MTADHRYDHLRQVRVVLATLVYPVQFVVNLPLQMLLRASESVSSRERLLEDNERLREEKLLLNARLQRFFALEAENERLRALLESSTDLHEKLLVAELMKVELQPFRQQVMINKGSLDDVYPGQPVIDSGGIVGQVARVTPFTSTVLLITDPTHAIPVQVNRNGLRGVAVGTGRDHTLSLEHLPNDVDIKVGDLIISSGLGGRFPRGYPVGKVSGVSRIHGEPFINVTMVTSATPSQSNEVLLVRPSKEQEEQRAEREEDKPPEAGGKTSMVAN